ncbi:hypothetical protein QFZ82_001152 [Streptomyces sp. V4I23]|uniref:hypothetical protein n=1 Tax=Streptomyces sp. V4I23 TaxID=3042282 RepID=UPI002783EC7D|nr:hypothetical protein [Streptomyces sp. V4I23]MDQ1006667.1 hypothetical protein [Streptomyces sp. V4I23]
MPTLSDLVARFPLVPRPRPACLPLPQRVRGLAALAQTAADANDPVTAAAVYNQAALLASDIGLPDLAYEMCHQHAAAYLHAAPLPAETAIRALEPVVNLARLKIRSRQGDDGLDRLLRLSEAVSNGTADRFDEVLVPANLIQTAAARQEVRAWLWRVLLADGSRALTGDGRWNEALTHAQEHRGVGTRMLDGRQIAVIAALTNGETTAAAELIAETEPGDPWERAVTACLHALCHRTSAGLDRTQENELAAAVLAVPSEPGTTVFGLRLGLTALDTIGPSPTAQRIVHALHRRITHASDGAAAREAQADALFDALSTREQKQSCRDLIEACGLSSGNLPAPLRQDLQGALRISDRVILSSFAPA